MTKISCFFLVFMLVLSLVSCQQEGPVGPQGDRIESYPDGYFRIVSSGLHTKDGTPYSVNLELKNSFSPWAQGYMARYDNTTLEFGFNRYSQYGDGNGAYASIYTDTSASTITRVDLTVYFAHPLGQGTKVEYRGDGELSGPTSSGDTLRFQRFVHDKVAHRIQGEFTLTRPNPFGTSPAVVTCTFDCAARPFVQ